MLTRTIDGVEMVYNEDIEKWEPKHLQENKVLGLTLADFEKFTKLMNEDVNRIMGIPKEYLEYRTPKIYPYQEHILSGLLRAT